MSVPAPLSNTHAEDDPLTREQIALIKALLVTVRHFFGGFQHLFAPVSDPRNPSFITYPLACILTAGLLLFLFRLGARRQIQLLLRWNGPSEAKFCALFGVESCPHGDTLNVTFARLDPFQVQEVVSGTVETLIRKKVLYHYRLLDRYFLVAVDGTGMLTFAERHCPHCLTRTLHGRTIYYHPLLEAKLVTRDGLVLSLMSEFIENPQEYPTRQDCELTAFYRLAARLKQRFPRLPICLLLDGLYAGGPTFALCEQYHWKYIITLKEADLPYIQQQFNALLPFFPENHLVYCTGIQRHITQDFHWVNDIEYVDAQGKVHTVSVLRCLETKPEARQGQVTTRFKWVTHLNLKATSVVTIANEGGRLRWKIENEGFNVQKNGGYALEHAYSRDEVATKVFYLLLQLAHTLAQLLERGSLFRKPFPAGVGAAKNLALRLLEAWRNLRLEAQTLQDWLNVRVQIRLRPP